MSLNTDNAILSNAIKVDSSYNVGIGGAASGSFKLQVAGAANITSDSSTTSRIRLTNTATGGNAWSISAGSFVGSAYGNSLFAIVDETAGNNLFVISKTGFVSMGTSVGTVNPSYNLQVAGTNTTLQVLDTTGNASSVLLTSTNTSASVSADYFTTAIPLVLRTGKTDRLTIAATGAATFSNSVTAAGVTIGDSDVRSSSNVLTLGGTSEVIRITGGNVGIGTSSPPTILTIRSGVSNTALSPESQVTITNTTSGNFATLGFRSVDSDGDHGRAGITVSKDSGSISGLMNFIVRKDAGSFVNAMSMTSNSVSARLGLTITGASGSYGSGDNPFLGLGTTSPDSFGAINAPYGERMKLNAYHGFEFKTSNSGGTPLTMMTINISGETTFAVLGTGALYSNEGRITNTNPSDINLKENVADVEYGLNEILKLRPVTYTWKNDKIKQGKQFGFIAQEVQEVMPDLVKEGEYLGLDIQAIFAIYTNAIQELKAEIDELKNK